MSQQDRGLPDTEIHPLSYFEPTSEAMKHQRHDRKRHNEHPQKQNPTPQVTYHMYHHRSEHRCLRSTTTSVQSIEQTIIHTISPDKQNVTVAAETRTCRVLKKTRKHITKPSHIHTPHATPPASVVACLNIKQTNFTSEHDEA